MRTALGGPIRELRRDRKISQEDLARQAGIPVKTLRALEHDMHTGSPRTIERIATVLGVTPSQLYSDELPVVGSRTLGFEPLKTASDPQRNAQVVVDGPVSVEWDRVGAAAVLARGTDAAFSVIRDNHHHLRLLALSLEQMARDRIAQIDEARPNDPDTIARNEGERDLLSTLADGFAQIAAALVLLEEAPNQPVLLGKAAEIAKAVGHKIQSWWEHNGEATINSGAKVSMLGAGTALLGLLGVDLGVGVSVVGGIVGGKEVVAALRRAPKGN